jgi:hypothetical protein
MRRRLQCLEKERIRSDNRSQCDDIARRRRRHDLARLLSRTDRSFSSATRPVALSSPKPVMIRRLLDFRQFKRAARHLYPNLPRNMLAKYGSDCGWIRKGRG